LSDFEKPISLSDFEHQVGLFFPSGFPAASRSTMYLSVISVPARQPRQGFCNLGDKRGQLPLVSASTAGDTRVCAAHQLAENSKTKTTSTFI
jgi:hypothetical protein